MTYNGWETFGEKLGSGAQGQVYKARSPARVAERRSFITKIAERLRQINVSEPYEAVPALAGEFVDLGSPDPSESLGAVKIFDFPLEGSTEYEKTRLRLLSEVRALRAYNHPAILKLLESGADQVPPFIVTEYFPSGTLHSNLPRFKGRAVDALQAFRPLVDAVVAIHEQKAIHRDIKPKNIFVGANGQLVLGDFGIVFFKDAEGRLTETYDRAGSRDWMAPWVNLEHRFALDELNPTLDIFPLGKVLWCMISGRHQLQFWYFDRAARGSMPANNLEALFPDDPAMGVINTLLAKCIVEEEDKCLRTAAQLLVEVDGAIRQIVRIGKKPEKEDAPWLCVVCNKGYYRKPAARWNSPGFADSKGMGTHDKLDVYFCDHCGHFEAFRK
jgi:serine/threonine protein kinase